MSRDEKSMEKIDIQRLYDLLAGKKMPEDLGDEVFLASYVAGVSGIIFHKHLMEVANLLDQLTFDELFILMLGYAMGQKDLEEQEGELEEMIKEGDIKLH